MFIAKRRYTFMIFYSKFLTVNILTLDTKGLENGWSIASPERNQFSFKGRGISGLSFEVVRSVLPTRKARPFLSCLHS